ncbi:MAG: hypothetical protein M0R80_13430 [Proteobacteria bacterium]|nr:hypothetical protein [Pseudomonadota bacterium]
MKTEWLFTIESGDKKTRVTLTEAEARQLYEDLRAMFCLRNFVVTYPITVPIYPYGTGTPLPEPTWTVCMTSDTAGSDPTPGANQQGQVSHGRRIRGSRVR